jgi:hypothetical protein
MAQPPVQYEGGGVRNSSTAELAAFSTRQLPLRRDKINGFCHIPRFGMGRMIKEVMQTEAFRASIDD